jgi:hypothetical protein
LLSFLGEKKKKKKKKTVKSAFYFFELEITYRISGSSPPIDPGVERSDMSHKRETVLVWPRHHNSSISFLRESQNYSLRKFREFVESDGSKGER